MDHAQRDVGMGRKGSQEVAQMLGAHTIERLALETNIEKSAVT